MRVVVPSTATLNRQPQQRNLWLAVGPGAAGAILLVVSLVLVQDLASWVLALAGCGLLVVGGWYGTAYLNYIHKQQTQELLCKTLEQTLGEDFIYFRNLALPGQRSIGLIDGVLLGPPGAVVIHVENQPGEYMVEGDTWYRTLRGKVNKAAPKPLSQNLPGPPITEPRRRLDDSPSWQAIRSAREVKAWLSVRGLPQVVVQPLVVLGNGKIRSIKRPSAPVLELWQVEEFVREKLQGRSDTGEGLDLATVVVEQIVQRLQTNGD